MRKIALITGVTGQDGSYLTELLLEKSHVLPALIRKIHLAKLLSENNKEAILKDLQVEAFSQAQIILLLHGITSKTVEICGSGKPKKEFLWSEDMTDACVHIIEEVDFKDLISDDKEVRNTHINIGTGIDISIKELAEKIKKIVGYTGKHVFNTQKLDGTLRKVTDVTKIHSLGWKHRIELEEGIEKMYNWYYSIK